MEVKELFKEASRMCNKQKLVMIVHLMIMYVAQDIGI